MSARAALAWLREQGYPVSMPYLLKIARTAYDQQSRADADPPIQYHNRQWSAKDTTWLALVKAHPPKPGRPRTTRPD